MDYFRQKLVFDNNKAFASARFVGFRRLTYQSCFRCFDLTMLSFPHRTVQASGDILARLVVASTRRRLEASRIKAVLQRRLHSINSNFAEHLK